MVTVAMRHREQPPMNRLDEVKELFSAEALSAEALQRATTASPGDAGEAPEAQGKTPLGVPRQGKMLKNVTTLKEEAAAVQNVSGSQLELQNKQKKWEKGHALGKKGSPQKKLADGDGRGDRPDLKSMDQILTAKEGKQANEKKEAAEKKEAKKMKKQQEQQQEKAEEKAEEKEKKAASLRNSGDKAGSSIKHTPKRKKQEYGPEGAHAKPRDPAAADIRPRHMHGGLNVPDGFQTFGSGSRNPRSTYLNGDDSMEKEDGEDEKEDGEDKQEDQRRRLLGDSREELVLALGDYVRTPEQMFKEDGHDWMEAFWSAHDTSFAIHCHPRADKRACLQVIGGYNSTAATVLHSPAKLRGHKSLRCRQSLLVRFSLTLHRIAVTSCTAKVADQCGRPVVVYPRPFSFPTLYYLTMQARVHDPVPEPLRRRAGGRVKLYPNKSPNAVGGPGIDDNWPAALIRDFRRAAGHGNAVKCEAETYEEALAAAEALMASEPADETGPVAVVEARIASLNIFIRFFVVSVIGTAFCYGMFKFAVLTNDFFECRQLFNSTHVFCVFSYELLHMVTKNTQLFQSVLMAQFLAFVTVVFTKLVNFAMRML
ncbi:hypothetical protein CYMTET_34972 [Cymbomonas tetramitiformis]|uniref:Uncharacterized protein n=1 Tax=Cymbomonas tetramitiformis TaxID=36881 RepID=A0AAE0FA80_9CHLO|nr:hypothetical protein CYMTET_34972 [Cymbomonas tetramitiformis]